MTLASSVQKSEQLTDLSKSAVSRYIQLATLFRRRIESGAWSIGDQIPTVEELAADFGVARATIRQAVGLLEAQGLIARYRAKGTFVIKRPQDQLWCEMETDFSGMLNARPGAEIEVLLEEKVDRPGQMPHSVGTLGPLYRHFKRLHSRDGEPYLIADVFLDDEICRKLPRTAFTTRTALRLAASAPDVRIIDARQTITIGTADIETAGFLNLALNAPVAHVSRSAVDQHGRLLLVTNGIYRGDVVRFDMKLK